MTDFEIRTAPNGLGYRVAAFKADAKATDTRSVLRIFEDECAKRNLSAGKHIIRGWDQRLGWVEHGGAA